MRAEDTVATPILTTSDVDESDGDESDDDNADSRSEGTATLIVCPASLFQRWGDEISK